ncbi:MAG: N-glycosylase/DNA lyase [Candidatus Woesearchaeota archaeon]
MASLLRMIKKLKASGLKEIIRQRIKEFETVRNADFKRIFSELCFCILTANWSAERAIDVQNAMGDDFLRLDFQKLRQRLKRQGHRFPNTRARYIIEARNMQKELEQALKNYSGKQLRDWIAETIPGCGYKEASHFLRNIGYKDFAIIDFHILDILARHGLITKPKKMNKRLYLEFEEVLKRISEKCGLSLGELDLYLWFAETKKVLK